MAKAEYTADDWRVRHFWDAMLKDGPMCLTKQNWQMLESKLGERDRVILKHLIESVEDEAKWIVKAREGLVSETARVRDIGIVMAKAGLRSYTDKEGRIYVADKET